MQYTSLNDAPFESCVCVWPKSGAMNLKVGGQGIRKWGGQYSKNTKVCKSWGVHDPPAPLVAPPL